MFGIIYLNALETFFIYNLFKKSDFISLINLIQSFLKKN